MKQKDNTISLNRKWKKRNQVVVIVKKNQKIKILLSLSMEILIMTQLHKIKEFYNNRFTLLKM